MISITENPDGTYTLKADDFSMTFATFELARQFMVDYANGEITKSIEL